MAATEATHTPGQTRTVGRRPTKVAPSRPRHHRPWVPYLFVAPAMLVFVAFVAVPFVQSAWYSFFDWDGITVGTWTGIDNYKTIVTDDVIRKSFVHAGVLILFFATIPIVAGLFI